MPTLESLEGLRREALQQNNQGRHRESAATYRRLLRLVDRLDTGDDAAMAAQARTLRVRAHLGMAFTFVLSARPDAGLALLDRAQEIAGERPDLRSIVHRQRGVVLANLGHVHESLQQFDLAARDESVLADMDIILLLMNRALAHAHLGHAAQAAADCDRLLALADPERFPVEHFMGTYNAGMIEYLAGDLPGALVVCPVNRYLFAGYAVRCESARASVGVVARSA